MKVVDYDEFQYDYSTYWNNRNYEHFAEVMALKRLLKNKEGRWFIDIGGAFGRLLSMYSEKYTNPIIFDYSLNTLINNKDRLLEKYPNVDLIAGNVYHLPFKESVFDGAMMIRVLHHIEDTPKYISELQRTMRNNSSYIQEYANKVHLKAKVVNFIKGNFKFFNQDPFQQPTAGNFEGSNGVESVFLNYHPKYIDKLLRNNGIIPEKTYGVSFLRIPFLKKLIPMKIILLIEEFLQRFFSWTHFSPSIITDSTVQKLGSGKVGTTLESILACPKCKGELNFKSEECQCKVCKNKYEKVAGIWDFRIQ